MESPAAAAGPRVYVPISHPDSPVPTYAVLQFLGISPPPEPSHTSPLPPHFPPSVHLLPCSSPASTPPSSAPTPKLCTSSTESSNSSSSDEKDKKLTSVKPSLMKKSGSGSGLASSCLSPGGRRSGRALPHGPTISITHTDKDTIIHTNSSNFREIVHQLTGAGSGDKGLMPVTMPPRNTTISIRSGVGTDKDFPPTAAGVVPSPSSAHTTIQNGCNNVEAAAVRKPLGNPTTKLLERRKSNKVLERLSTSCRNLPPLVPSPVTPLASDFEKISLPITPSTSEGSLTPTISPANLPAASHDARAMEILPASAAMPSSEIKAVLLQSHGVNAMLVDAKGSVDAQASRTSHAVRAQSPIICDGGDTQGPSWPNRPVQQSRALRAIMDGPGPSLVLATGGGGDVSLPEAMDTQNGAEMSAIDVMDAESLCDGGNSQASSSQRTDSGGANSEEPLIAKDGFFFHQQRPQHSDPMLLSLFPESSRGL